MERTLLDRQSQSQGNTHTLERRLTLQESFATILGINKKSKSPKELNTLGNEAKSALDTVSKSLRFVVCPECATEVVRLDGETCFECVEREFKKAEKAARVARVLGRYGTENFTFDKFSTPTVGHSDVKTRAMQFNAMESSVMLRGPCGSGKTHLACAILQAWAPIVNGSADFIRTSWLMRNIRGLRGPEEASYIERLSSRSILVLDDIGVGRATEFSLGVIYEIIEERIHAGRKGLILTSNLTLDEISKKFGDDRLSSRISGQCEIIEMGLPDHRAKAEGDEWLDR